jgi:hypothetical protein
MRRWTPTRSPAGAIGRRPRWVRGFVRKRPSASRRPQGTRTALTSAESTGPPARNATFTVVSKALPSELTGVRCRSQFEYEASGCAGTAERIGLRPRNAAIFPRDVGPRQRSFHRVSTRESYTAMHDGGDGQWRTAAAIGWKEARSQDDYRSNRPEGMSRAHGSLLTRLPPPGVLA